MSRSYFYRPLLPAVAATPAVAAAAAAAAVAAAAMSINPALDGFWQTGFALVWCMGVGGSWTVGSGPTVGPRPRAGTASGITRMAAN
ncbi:hypothetical protein QCA50_018188 [Cerrena zonata]|uniref:Secreted protein n=1 Tax=Cerrena zonata TaxID=2478898 RepID=A0AAW0FMD4_9APHY